jgi:hypothetical protein
MKEFRGSNEFQYCATCGRSNGVRLTFCKRCQKVCFCSKACKVAGWNNFHRHECQTPHETTPEDRACMIYNLRRNSIILKILFLVTTTKTVSSKNKVCFDFESIFHINKTCIATESSSEY